MTPSDGDGKRDERDGRPAATSRREERRTRKRTERTPITPPIDNDLSRLSRVGRRRRRRAYTQTARPATKRFVVDSRRSNRCTAIGIVVTTYRPNRCDGKFPWARWCRHEFSARRTSYRIVRMLMWTKLFGYDRCRDIASDKWIRRVQYSTNEKQHDADVFSVDRKQMFPRTWKFRPKRSRFYLKHPDVRVVWNKTCIWLTRHRWIRRYTIWQISDYERAIRITYTQTHSFYQNNVCVYQCLRICFRLND